jgi:ribosomal protein L32
LRFEPHWGKFPEMPQEKNAHLKDRARKAAKIVSQPSDYKVCEGCESIVRLHVVTCPNCHGYRFDDDAGAVVIHAKLLASREQRSVVEEDLF